MLSVEPRSCICCRSVPGFVDACLWCTRATSVVSLGARWPGSNHFANYRDVVIKTARGLWDSTENGERLKEGSRVFSNRANVLVPIITIQHLFEAVQEAFIPFFAPARTIFPCNKFYGGSLAERILWKAVFFLLSISVSLGNSRTARACDVPSPVKSIDPPGFYDDAAGYAEAVKPMRGFIAKLNRAADTGQWSCTLDLLDSWAKADALMGPISGYQGYYERSWAGTDFALVLLRVPSEIRETNAGRMATINVWLEHIAVGTRDSDAINHLHNNLVYWAGLNLIAIGTVTHRSELIDAGLARAREGIHDIGPDGALEREVKRGNRALHYHTFALIPLVFTAELAQQQHVDLYQENNHAIARLANLVTEAVINPSSFAKITPVKQDLFPWTFQDGLAWMEPYYAHTKDTRLPKLIAPRRPFNEWRLGGNVTAAWGVSLSPYGMN